MGRKPMTNEERLIAYEIRLQKAREYARKMRLEFPDLCRQRVRASYSKHPDNYKSIIRESAKSYYLRKKQVQI